MKHTTTLENDRNGRSVGIRRLDSILLAKRKELKNWFKKLKISEKEYHLHLRPNK